MNLPGEATPPPINYQPSGKTFPVALIIVSLAGLLGLLTMLAVADGIKAFNNGGNDALKAISVGDSFIDNMGQHSYPAAHSLFTTQLQVTSPTNDLKDIEMLMEKHHGTLVTHGQPQWFRRESGGQVTVHLSYRAQFSRNVSQSTVTLIKTDKGYQVHDFRYEL